MNMEISSKIFQYTVYFQPLSEGGFNVVVPALPEICTFGETLGEAKANAREAIECVIESELRHGKSIPEENHSVFKDTIQVALPA